MVSFFVSGQKLPKDIKIKERTRFLTMKLFKPIIHKDGVYITRTRKCKRKNRLNMSIPFRNQLSFLKKGKNSICHSKR